MQQVTKKPTVVTVIGWIFIVFSGLSIMSGAMGLVTFNLMRRMSDGAFPPMGEDVPEAIEPMLFIFRYFDLLAFLQIIFACFTLFAGIQFLRLRAWARTALEVIAWLGLTYIVVFGIFWILSWVGMTTGVSAQGAGGPPAGFAIFGAIMGVVVMAVTAAPAVVIIVFLRKPNVREAMVE